jgi:hypothetical protein
MTQPLLTEQERAEAMRAMDILRARIEQAGMSDPEMEAMRMFEKKLYMGYNLTVDPSGLDPATQAQVRAKLLEDVEMILTSPFAAAQDPRTEGERNPE